MAKKRIINTSENISIESLEGTLEDINFTLQSQIDYVLSKNSTASDFKFKLEYGGCYECGGSPELYLEYTRDETDKERENRIKRRKKQIEKNKKIKEEKEERERKEFERLKAKYE